MQQVSDSITSLLFVFRFFPLSFYLLILFLFCLYLLSSFLFLSLSFLSFYSFVFIIKRDESKKALSVLFATNIKKNKSQFISFLFRPSFGVKRTICFLILLPLPFPPRTAGLNSCCYDAQRQGARRLPGTQFISLKPKMILKQLFFYTFNWQMWRMPERAISERSVQPMLCGERSRGL